ncbi:putative hscarg dehydrogenase [Pseudovirgaria hyperparasitica]|uniref:Putative hscarg dehydrogenase n=1 Tax=Pseudovirgaria hyperparasitica TaxID=470096 RepID=A0A6A6WII1_9PEZI|nr:putative hscarg dehydrogenase [Pseudovirgaria hyperparasitica]KAF2760971.1 putative hscarg dehydrogenase [Pseudovirgaria hyperparasitica]
MTRKRIIAVLGATRGQGGSVVDALLKTGRYNIRGVTTEDTETPAAHRLKERGVNVVHVNLDDPDSIAVAFTSAHVIFAVTTMYDGAMEREVTQGKNIADVAAALESLEHFVWSTLPSATTVSRGTMAVPHMDGKAQVDEYIIDSHPELARKTTFYWGGMYAENVTYAPFMPAPLPSAGRYVWVQPVARDTLVPMVGDHTVNTGLFVQKILEKPSICLPVGYVLGVVEWMPHGEMLSAWAAVLGDKKGHEIDAVYVKSDVETVGQLWPSTGKELGQLLKFAEEFGRKSWTKKGVNALEMQDLDLEIGEEEGKLVSTKEAIRKLGSKF